MIVTRQRKVKKSNLPILLPIAAITMLAIAFTWPPSRNFITGGPLHPVFDVLGKVWGTVSAPLQYSYAESQITQLQIEKRQLNDKLEADRKVAEDKDNQLSALQKQIAALQAQPAPDAASSPAAQASAAAAGAPSVNGAQAGAASQSSTAADSLRRVAGQWASMDPENAAALAQKLSPDYDAAVFAQMSPDNVGPIMDALPPVFAASIVQAASGGTALASPAPVAAAPAPPAAVPSPRAQVSAPAGR